MTTELPTWDRQYYVAGGGEPLLFYVVFGKIVPTVPMSRSRYRSSGVPPGINIQSYGLDNDPDVPASFRSGYLWDEFLAADPELAATVNRCENCLILRGSPSDSTTLDYLRDVAGLMTYLTEQGGCAIYDPLMFQWWSPEDWKQQIFEPAAAVPTRHTVLLVSEERDTSRKWFHSRGMRKFGRPDISVRGVPIEREEGVVDLCNRLIVHQALGYVIPDQQEVKMASLPPGGIIRQCGDLEDPDFNNVHLDVSWPQGL